MIRIAIVVLLLKAIVYPEISSAEIKTFTKEYTYQASELDSKSTSRTLALEQAKRMLLEELGVFLTSQTEVVNSALTKDQITSITAGIVSAEVLDERWDGHSYWLKAKIEADPTVVQQAIKVIVNDTKKSTELDAARKRIGELTSALEAVKADLGSSREERKKRYNKIINQKNAMDWLVIFFNAFDEKKGFAENKDAIEAINKAIEMDPEYSVSYYLRAIIHGEVVKDTQKALDDISKAIKLYTPGPKTFKDIAGHYEYRAHLYLRNNDNHKAISDLTTALEINRANILNPLSVLPKWKTTDIDALVKKYPKDYRVYVLRGRYNSHFLSSRSNPKMLDQAISDLQKSLKINNKNMMAYFILIDAHRCKAWNYAMKRTTDKIDVVNYNAIIDVATKGLKQSKDELSKKSFLTERANEFLKLKRYKLAITDYDDLIKIDPDAGGFYYDRGLANKGLKYYSSAISDFTKAMAAKKPTLISNDEVFGQIADACIEQGDSENAILNFSKGIEYGEQRRKKIKEMNIEGLPFDNDEMLAGLYEKRGWQYEQKKDYENALKDYNEAINYSTDNISITEKRSDLFVKMGRYDDAIVDINTIMGVYKKYSINLASLYLKRGRIYDIKGEIKSAINDYDITLSNANLSEDPHLLVTHFMRGRLYSIIGNSEQALLDFDTYVKAYPKSPDGYSQRGVAYFNTGNTKMALRDLDYSIKLDPKNEITYYYRAEVHNRSGNIVAARNDYKIAARLGDKVSQNYLKSKGVSW